MLCEKCHQKEATVHFTVLTPEKILQRRDFCDACAPTPDQMKEETLKTFMGEKGDAPPGERSNDEV
jgi:protein-arginine kinase activator protein McsA